MRYAECHKDRKHASNGLCDYCYTKQRRDEFKSKGLCQRCGKNPSINCTTICEFCKNKYAKDAKEWRAREGNRERQLATNKRIREEERKKVLDHYGRSCVCCGETEKLFLEMDHINGGGNIHRREIGTNHLTHWLIKNNFPPIVQTMCANCNKGRQINGGVCPHKTR